ncbi:MULTISPECIES: alpha/beta fold hydrolase [Lactobacillaceae]|uniref:alpha/beta fold hydrolase n=1 Tax=Lactobacillaceae TaxID=33958 RepID=UPI0007B55ABA|nr:alpha/beta hydrolase [Lactiplantibacillus plantarum]KZU27785.1 halo peroxidase [Lactiplantibacillus plantarum]KZU75021.1 halo peroxidase [Lactiplantibacillus plantarum]MCJ2385326.1 alpha/beta hydrolase [Lactiplantibacillus plantarum]MCK8475245.1 alpha/beta hydrolase [Lactiplantibacillus plantarum]
MLLSVSGAELAVEIQGSGRPLVFVNGFGSYKEIWCDQVKTFARRYQAVYFDARGQGESTGSVAMDLATQAMDLDQVLKQLELKRPVLIGHSMGASVIWAWRKLHRDVPLAGIVVVDQSPKMLNDDNWQFGFVNLTAETEDLQLMTPRPGHETLHGMAPQVMYAFLRAESQHPFDRVEGKALLQDHFEADWRGGVMAEAMPVLYVCAAQSPYFPIGYGPWLEEHNRCVRAVVLQSCGHDIMAEVPEAFDQTLRHFLMQHA